MEIVKHSQHVPVERYALSFEWEDQPGSGFSFPCDAEGNLLMDEIPDTARDNLEKCLSGAYAVKAEGIKDYSYTYFAPAIGKCLCERLVTLDDGFANACDCGLEYNMSGQLLAPRSQWEEPWDADDPFNVW